MMTKKKLEIYVHVPFCARKCDYCDFVSFVTDSETQRNYFAQLQKQLINKSELTESYVVGSIFFGGGTPSLPDSELILETMDTIRNHFAVLSEAEISIEMNPNSVTQEKLQNYKRAGINRISIGLQSTDNNELKALSRLHSYEEFCTAYKLARDAGFDNINVDLMAAIPGQNLASYQKSLSRVLELNPEHISAYSLIIEEGTPFYQRYNEKGCKRAELPSEEEERKMYYCTKKMLTAAGYHRYEISNYARSGYECRHNVGYWRRVPYIGVGIAAASLLEECRYQMHSDLSRYLKGDFTEEATILTRQDEMEEFMFLGLRMSDGVSHREFLRLFSKKPEEVYEKAYVKLKNEGLIEVVNRQGDKRTILTDKGFDVANYCMAEFLL